MLKDEEFLSVGLLALTAFMYLNVSRDVGTFFSIASICYLIPVMSRRKDWIVEFFKKIHIEKSAIAGVGTLVVWLLFASFLLTYIKPQFTFSVIDTVMQLGAYTNVPVLSADPTIRLFTYGIAIPIIETTFFLSFMLLFWAKLFRVKVMWHSTSSHDLWKMIWVCVLVGITASLFHMTTRMMADFALIVDFIFFFISALIVFRYNELLPAAIFHALANSLILLIGGA